MRRFELLLGFCASLLCYAASSGAAQQPARHAAEAPAAGVRAIVLRGELLEKSRTRLLAGDRALRPAYDKLVDDAVKALRQPLVAVTQKSGPLPPSGDKHDYFSLSPYWWPDPAKPDGLPYIRRDGVTNPESKRDLDQPRVARLGANVHTLALAYYFSGEERFAARAAEQLRTWFLDPATRMNPHLRFAQLVRGNPRERGSGIIDTRWFIEVVDAASLIEGSRSWSASDRDSLRAWMAEYLRWLRTSPNGQHEHAAKNNHGSWFAAQTAALALYAGDTAAAREIIAAIPARIASQITATGDQPIENERTRSFHYAGFNIEALSRLAEMGRHVGVDLWGYQAPEGGSLRRAIDHVAKHLAEPSTWPGRQIDPIEMELFLIHLRRAGRAIPGADYSAILKQLPAKLVREDRSALLYLDG
jgi:hypothetical protein